MSNSSDKLLDVLLALKSNIMKDLNVSKLAIVEELKSTQEIYCRLLNEGDLLVCYKLKDITLNVNDLVLIIFNDSDFRINMNRIINGQNPILEKEEKNPHNIDYGIIIGKIGE